MGYSLFGVKSCVKKLNDCCAFWLRRRTSLTSLPT